MKFIPTRVKYPEGGISNFDVLIDNWRISKMHTKLFLESIPKWPELLQYRKTEHWSHIEERRGLLGMQTLLALYRLFGRKVFEFALFPVLVAFWIVAKGAKAESLRYLKQLQKYAGEKNRTFDESLTTYKHFHHFADSILDKIASWMGDIRYGIDAICEDEETKRTLTAKEGVGCIIFVSHLGTAEACRAIAENEEGVPINALIFDEHAPRFKEVVEKLAPKARIHVIPVNEIGIETAVMLKEKLSRGEWVAIAADRTPIKSRENESSRITYVNFLGKKAPFPTGPYLLASILKAPVCILFANRKNGKMWLWAREFLSEVKLPRRMRDVVLNQYVEKYVRLLEERVFQYPLEWFNFYDFWAGDKNEH